jgi:hypothetical protein
MYCDKQSVTGVKAAVIEPKPSCEVVRKRYLSTRSSFSYFDITRQFCGNKNRFTFTECARGFIHDAIATTDDRIKKTKCISWF